MPGLFHGGGPESTVPDVPLEPELVAPELELLLDALLELVDPELVLDPESLSSPAEPVPSPVGSGSVPEMLASGVPNRSDGAAPLQAMTTAADANVQATRARARMRAHL